MQTQQTIQKAQATYSESAPGHKGMLARAMEKDAKDAVVSE